MHSPGVGVTALTLMAVLAMYMCCISAEASPYDLNIAVA